MNTSLNTTTKAVVLALACASLSACNAQVKAPGATVKGDGFEVEIDGGNSSHHCPPGHRKKGWC